MSWSFKAGTIMSGQTVGWSFWWGDDEREYEGIQVVQAKAVPTDLGGGVGIQFPSTLTILNPRLSYLADEVLGYTYSFDVRNDGFDTDYEIVGTEVG